MVVRPPGVPGEASPQARRPAGRVGDVEGVGSLSVPESSGRDGTKIRQGPDDDRPGAGQDALGVRMRKKGAGQKAGEVSGRGEVCQMLLQLGKAPRGGKANYVQPKLFSCLPDRLL